MIRLTVPFQFVLSFLRKLRNDHVSSFSAETTLFMVISCFPFLMFLLTLIDHLPISADSLQLIFYVFLPEQFTRKLLPPFANQFIGGSNTMLATTAVAFLWAGSKGFLALERGMNNVYDATETRNYVLRRLLSLIYTLFFALFIVFVLIVFVFGNRIASQITYYFPAAARLTFIVKSLRGVIGILILAVLFDTIYLLVPNRRARTHSFFTELPGAVFASAGWIIFSYLYSFYIDNMSNYSAIYGNLTAIVLCLLWLYVNIYILFIGAEINMLLFPVLTVKLGSRKKVK